MTTKSGYQRFSHIRLSPQVGTISGFSVSSVVASADLLVGTRRWPSTATALERAGRDRVRVVGDGERCVTRRSTRRGRAAGEATQVGAGQRMAVPDPGQRVVHPPVEARYQSSGRRMEAPAGAPYPPPWRGSDHPRLGHKHPAGSDQCRPRQRSSACSASSTSRHLRKKSWHRHGLKGGGGGWPPPPHQAPRARAA